MRLPLDPFYMRVLRVWFSSNPGVSKRLESDGGESLFVVRHSLRFEMPLHIFQTVYLPKKFPKKNDKGRRRRADFEQEKRPTPFEQEKRPTPSLARVMAAKVKELHLGSTEDNRQKKAIEEVSKEATLEEVQNIATTLVPEELSSRDDELLAKKKKTGPPVRARRMLKRIMQGTKTAESMAGKEKRLRKKGYGQTSSGASETQSRKIFDSLIGDLERKILSSLTKDLEFYQALGAEGCQKYLNKP
ncbi:hypothetical protein Adt_21494 [Abeliophyllum distichum]|uniref:Uncharacterized protein n=1 Tax=Abeliophyllum distichum TaxID=126358 RepID=A0ABD1SZM8_9LAMI